MASELTPGEREAAVSKLSAAFADDMLEMEEFERRLTGVYEATTAHALVALTRDLPTPDRPAASGEPDHAPTALSRRVDSSALDVDRAPIQHVRSVLSSVERDLRGAMPAVLDVRSVFGNAELDLRDAIFPPGITEIRVRALCGNVEIDLPGHVDIENDGRSVAGNFAVRQRRRRGNDAPNSIVRITGRALLSNVEIEAGDD